jgi:tetratricopeptide (TPR) repeat protein
VRLFQFSIVIFLSILNCYGMTVRAEFVGSEACSSCHVAEFEDWQGSHHELAMQHAAEATVSGDFSDSSFTHKGVTSRFYRKDGKYLVFTDDHEGKMREYEISYSFGVEPLQQYLIAFPDGRLQALSIAWDDREKKAGGQKWFHLYPDEDFTPGDSLHWTGRQQNWNYMCADCHSTNLKKGYSEATNSFETTWSEINVACEACHGPGSKHVEWTAKEQNAQAQDLKKGLAFLLNERVGVSWLIDPLSGNASRSVSNHDSREIQVCASCHSRRGTIRAGADSDAEFLGHHLPALLTEGLYYPDGQIQDEVYVWASFQQSKMFSKGVTCSDCHEPHSLKLRAEGAAVCSQCHLDTTYATESHHMHPLDSDGADCLDCHMPETTYMQVDPRRDHSIRIPRPDLSVKFDTPNACNSCHVDQSVEWTANAFTRWYADIAEPFQNWTLALDKARRGDPTAELSLLGVTQSIETPDIARATALAELQNFLSPLSGPVAQKSLSDDSPLVRLGALRALQQLPIQNLYPLASPLLEDPVLAVRSEAARMLAAAVTMELTEQQAKTLNKSIRDYISTQSLHADRVESQMNLGNLYQSMGEAGEAEKRYRRALKLDPNFSPAYVNLSDLYRAQGLNEQSLGVLQEALQRQPESADLHHSLGLAMVRRGDNQKALIALKTASELEPQTPRYAYVYGVALNSTGRSEKAIQVLTQAHNYHPRQRDIIFALATIYRDAGNRNEAVKWTHYLLEINPGDATAHELLKALEKGQ